MSVLVADIVDFGQLYFASQSRTGPVVISARDVWFPVDVQITGPGTDTTPQAFGPEDSGVGVVQGGINDFLYGHIYVFPANIDLGNLVSEESRPISIWNATFTDATVSAPVGAGTTGLTLTEPFASPFTLAPLQEAQYQVAVSLDGPASLSATYTFTVNGVESVISIVGIRVVLWPFPPAWDSNVNESLEWMTDVIRSKNGKEQRISLRTRPRRRMDYDFQVTRTNVQHFNNLTFAWGNRAFAVPYWQYRCWLTAPIAAGATTIPMNTVDAGFAVGQTMCLFKNADVFEVIEIAAVADDHLQLVNGVLSAWPINSAAYPVAVSTLETSAQATNLSESIIQGSCSFIASPTATDPFVPAVDATELYNGYEVITYRPDWSNNLDAAKNWNVDVIDFQVGDRDISVSDEAPVLQRGFRWILKRRRDVRLFRELLGRLRGQQCAVYIPSLMQDMSVVGAISETGTTLTVVDRNFFNLIGGANPYLGHLMLLMRDGTHYYRPIFQVGKTGNDINVNISTALGVAYEPEDFKAVYYLQLWRLAADRQTINWLTDQSATVDQIFQLAGV